MTRFGQLFKYIRSRRFLGGVAPVLSVVLGLGACSVSPEEETAAERAERVAADRGKLKELAFANNRRLMFEPVTLEEAVARAVRFNLTEKVTAFETALKEQGLTVANLDMLPALVAQAGYSRRTNRDRTFSESRELGVPNKEGRASTASDQGVRTASLEFSWNILDFGVSYLAARQASNAYLIARESQRGALQNFVREVQSAFWRSIAAENVLSRWDMVSSAADESLKDIRALRASGVSNLRENYQAERALLDLASRLEDLRVTLVATKIELSNLMGAPPGVEFRVFVPELGYTFPKEEAVLAQMSNLETSALANRPEIREQVYRGRIAKDAIRGAILEMIPGLRLSASGNYTSDSFKRENAWLSYGPSISYNLFSVFEGPAKMKEAEISLDLAKARRLAISMASLAQLHISVADYFWNLDRFDLASQLIDVNSAIAEQIAAEGKAGLVSDVEKVRAALDYMVSVFDYYNSYGRLNNSYTRVLSSAGIDYITLSDTDDSIPYEELLAKVRSRLKFDKRLYIERAVAGVVAKLKAGDKKGAAEGGSGA